MNHTTLQLEKLTCPSCMQKIIDTVNDLAGVEQTKILFDRSKARVFFDSIRDYKIKTGMMQSVNVLSLRIDRVQ